MIDDFCDEGRRQKRSNKIKQCQVSPFVGQLFQGPCLIEEGQEIFNIQNEFSKTFETVQHKQVQSTSHSLTRSTTHLVVVYSPSKNGYFDTMKQFKSLNSAV